MLVDSSSQLDRKILTIGEDMFSKPFLLNGLTNYMRNMIITHILIQLLHILLHITNFITVHVLHNYYTYTGTKTA